MPTLPKVLDYSKYLTLVRNQGDAGGCGGMSALHAIDVLMEMDMPYTPDLSYAFNSYVYNDSMGLHGPRDSSDHQIGVSHDTRVIPGLNQLGVLVSHGCCPETSFRTNYDPPAAFFPSEPAPSNQSFQDALTYRIQSYTPYPGKVPASIDELKLLLYEHGPLIMINGDHAVTLLGYNDTKRMIKYVNSVSDSSGWGGVREYGYDHFTDRFRNHGDSVEWMDIIPPARPEPLTARIRVQHHTGRRFLSVSVGVEGREPLIVWNRNCQVNMFDDRKDLAIDVPLPGYASEYWPPDASGLWFVQVEDSSPGTAGTSSGSLVEATLVSRKVSRITQVFGGEGGVIYGVTSGGDLLWWRHLGWLSGQPLWRHATARKVGSGWFFRTVFSAGSGVIYGVTSDGQLVWYRHLGASTGTSEWAADSGKRFGSGWFFPQIFSGDDGVIYGIDESGNLLWYRHSDYMTGGPEWVSDQGRKVGEGWRFQRVFSGGKGVIYAVADNGDLLWYRHEGYEDGSANWTNNSGRLVSKEEWREEWRVAETVLSGGDGVLYSVKANGDLVWARHLGQRVGTSRWSPQTGFKLRPARGFLDRYCALELFKPAGLPVELKTGSTARVSGFARA